MTEHDTLTVLRGAGFRATGPRIAFLDVLRNSEVPLAAADIASTMGRQADLVTVYRIAELFEKAGLVRRIELRAGKAFYEYADRHHHHIVCTDCGNVEDVDMCLPQSFANSIITKSKSFNQITAHALEFFGTCTKCSYA